MFQPTKNKKKTQLIAEPTAINKSKMILNQRHFEGHSEKMNKKKLKVNQSFYD